MRKLRMAPVVVVLALIAPSAASAQMAIAAYFYPGASWTQMDQAQPHPQIAVMNPASGPGTASNSQYVSAVRTAQAAGITVIGYVHTSYGSRSLSTVKSEIDSYYRWYRVNGIFVDEASTNCRSESYYATLNSYVKAKGGTARTILNPGTQTNECYVPAADVLLTFEDSFSHYVTSYSAPSWVTRYAPSHFWHLIYATPMSGLAQAISLSKTRGAGYVYVTPDTLPNPYDTLPTGSYWSDELADIGS
jgi:hypothetical protein